MSGGVFNYAYARDAASFLTGVADLDDLSRIAEFLEEAGYPHEARNVELILHELQNVASRIEEVEKKLSSLSPLLKAAEWVASKDWGPEEIEKAALEL